MNDKYCESEAEPRETDSTHQSVITQHRQRYFSLKRRSAEQRQECLAPGQRCTVNLIGLEFCLKSLFFLACGTSSLYLCNSLSLVMLSLL